jgi:hypothetical protein
MELLSFINNLGHTDDFMIKFHHALLKEYPGLQMRWARIHGKRWAHLYGESAVLALQPLRIQLSQNYGIILDNPELIPKDNLDELIAVLKEYFR